MRLDTSIVLVLIYFSKASIIRHDASSTTSEPTTTSPNYGAYKPNSQVCYENVGCFSNSDPFTNAAFYLPIAPDVLKTKFSFYTGLNENISEEITYRNEDSVRLSKFNPNNKIKLIIHGFSNNGSSPWITSMLRSILIKEKGNVNLITVDWGIGAAMPFYYNASANTRLVGVETCLLIKVIRKVFYENVWSAKLNIHCIGHSLGAHTCGYASTHCESQFDRITAMDPAGPNFSDMHVRVRIDPSDAKFVDVIHSNGDSITTGSLGIQAPVGHVDFYPNGGRIQPGCPSVGASIITLLTNISAAFDGASCSHSRAYELFSDSILSSCPFTGYPCKDQAEFDKGNCFDCGTQGCAIMGYATSTKARGVKYSVSMAKMPFCGYAYQVQIQLAKESFNKTAGEIILSIKNGDNVVNASITKITDDLVPGSIYSRVFAHEADMQLELASLSFHIVFNRRPKPFIGVDTNGPEIQFDKVKILSGETGEQVSYCGDRVTLRDKESYEIQIAKEEC